MTYLSLAIVFLFTPGIASAVTLTSTSAGYAGTVTQSCFGDTNNFEIEILYNTYLCERRGIVEFDVSETGLTAASSAIVSIFDGAVGNSERAIWPVDVYAYVGDGLVTGSDFDAGFYFSTVYWDRYAPDASTFQIDLTAYVNSQLALGTSFVGLNLRPNDPYNCSGCSNAFIYFDGAGGNPPPTLTLQPVPIPSALWLFGSALGVMGWTRSRD